MHTIVALADPSFFWTRVHGYVVCINFLVVELLSNVYTSTPIACVPYPYQHVLGCVIQPFMRSKYRPLTLIYSHRLWHGTLSRYP
jgi:hypothetical protein